MKKITSFLSLLLFCCISAVAQYSPGDVIGTEKPVKTKIKIGTAQAEMVPNKWYFLHSPLEVNSTATDFVMPGDPIPYAGGLLYEDDWGTLVTSTVSEIDALSSEEGVLSDTWFSYMVRFVPVSGKEGVYNVELGNGNYMFKNPVQGTTAKPGSAGQFNFYLVKREGQPNTAGRFAWSQDYMKQYIITYGAGDYWGLYCDGDGEVTAENAGNSDLSLGDEGIRGDMLWQLYDIVVAGNADPYKEVFDILVGKFVEIDCLEDLQFADNLTNGINVGTAPGNYRKEYVDAFLALHTEVEVLLDASEQSMDLVKEKFPTVESLEDLINRYVASYEALIANKVPLAMPNIAPGYYTINSMHTWYNVEKDTVYYTQEEADAYNAEAGLTDGEEGFVKEGDIKKISDVYVPAPIRSLCSLEQNGEAYLGWAQLDSVAEFLWKVETVEGKPTQYRLINMHAGKVFNGITTYSNAKLAEPTDTNTTVFDFKATTVAPVTEKEVTAVNIRARKHKESGHNYIMISNTNEQRGLVMGWEGSSDAAQWYLEPVDAATADLWLNGPEAQLKKMIEFGDSIKNAFPAQLAIAKDLVKPVNVASTTTFSSPYHCPMEGSIAGMFDGNASTFWHANWQAGVGFGYNTTTGTNYFVVNDVAEALNGNLYVEVTRRNAQNDHLTELTVYGTNDAYDAAADKSRVLAEGDELYQWTELGVLQLPFASTTETVKSNAIEFEGKYKYYKFVATATTTNRGYFHMAEFRLYPATETKLYPTTQYDVRKAEADALQAAVDAWTAAAFNYENVELLNDNNFKTIYSNLVSAAEAWSAVFVNPAALRQVIANAPSSEYFVIGNNPGQWKEGSATPTAVIAEAQAYNASGAYTKEQSQAWIDAIKNAVDNVYNIANPIETDKWYRIKFPTEQMFDQYGWSKAYAQATTGTMTSPYSSPALFGKKLATGTCFVTSTKHVNKWGDSYVINEYVVEPAEQIFEGNGVYFLNSDEVFENGEDLFRFIKASDSTFMIQNKATGLFIRSGYPTSFSAVPSLFQQFAIGAGANVLYARNVLGNADEGYGYLYALGTDNSLTTWISNTLGSNGMLLIEEAMDVTEEPATSYTTKMWPGKVYTYTMPVDFKVVEGATAYDATLVVGESDTTVVLKSFEAGATIAHGTPFVLIADSGDDYITPSALLEALKEEKKAELGVTSLNDSIVNELKQIVEFTYLDVVMEHGTELDAEVHNGNGLTGVIEGFTAQAGKAVVANENGFAHTQADTHINSYTAYIASDFDASSSDVKGTIKISFEGGESTGINEVLNKVSKNGNIYNAAGQIVAKGNINTINNLPAGVYIINGMKVTKQ